MEAMTPREWFDLFYGDMEPGEWLTLFSSAGEEKFVDWATVGDLDEIAEKVALRLETCDVWFGVATRKENLGTRRGGKDDCCRVPALWVDIDIAGPGHQTTLPLPTSVEEALELVRSFPIPPTVIVHSGGGLQAWWLFLEPLEAAEAQLLLDRWGYTWHQLGEKKGWHVDEVEPVRSVDIVDLL